MTDMYLAQPRKLRSRAEVAKLPFIGTKLARLVEAFVETGSIPEVTATLKSQRYKSLSLLSSIYGIGPTTARLLYGKGVRTLEDLQRWYDVDPDAPEAVVDGVETIQNGNEEEGKEGLIRAALGFRADLEVK
jgi:DNA polymerase IV